MEKILTKDEEIALIAGRIMDEFRKHPDLNWSLIAAQKIHGQFNEYYNDKIRDLENQLWLSERQLKSSKQDIQVLFKEFGIKKETKWKI